MNIKIILIFFLSVYSCQTLQHDTRQLYWDSSKQFCAERLYHYDINFIGPVGKFVQVPSEKCSIIIGTTPEQYIDDNTFFESVRLRLAGGGD